MKRAVVLTLMVGVAACGTLGNDEPAAVDVPSAGIGPFRALKDAELRGTAPFVLSDSRAVYTDPAVLEDGAGVILYAASAGTIVRTRSLDGRTFFGNGQIGKSPLVVLRPDQAWEGPALEGPFALRRGSETLLYYAAAGGIGLAHSPDGLTFTKESAPVLQEGHAPTVFALPDGRLRMLFTSEGSIIEAESSDAVSWQRLGPVLGPSLEASAFDAVAVDDASATTRVTPAGRFQVRVLYTGTSVSGATAIGFAARYGDDGPFDRNPVQAFGSGRAPAFVAPFLYVASGTGIAGAIDISVTGLAASSDFPPTP